MSRYADPVSLSSDVIQAQLRRAHRWDLPKSARAYPTPEVKSELRIHIDTAPVRRSWSLLRSGAWSLLLNLMLLAAMAMLPAPRQPLYSADDPLQIVIAEPRQAAPLESLPVDIATPLGQERKWTHFDQPLSRPSRSFNPLAVPSVIDRFTGNPLSLSPESGGDMVVGGDAGRASRGRGVDGADFLGVRARGERFVFVLDNTLGMYGEPWRECKRELLAAVSRLRAGQQFAVVLVDGTVYEEGPRQGLLSARSDSNVRLAPWLDTCRLVDRADPAEAVKAAVELRPDAIYLLGGAGFPASAVERVRSSNKIVDDEQLKMPAAVMHTIGIAASPDLAAPLQQIAEQNGGHFFFLSVEDR